MHSEIKTYDQHISGSSICEETAAVRNTSSICNYKTRKKTVEQSFQRNTGAASEDLEKDMNQELTQLLNVYNSRTAALNNKDIR